MGNEVINGFDFSALPITVHYAGEGTEDKGWEHDLWRVTIGQGMKSWTTDYKTGIGHRAKPKTNNKWEPIRPIKPTNASIIHCLLLDSDALERSFTDWCDEFGYSNDSLSAFDTYRECCSIGEKMRKVFDRSQIAVMREALRDF